MEAEVSGTVCPSRFADPLRADHCAVRLPDDVLAVALTAPAS
jgi:hypothetical protein